MSRTKDAIMDYHAELGIEDAFYPRGWPPKKGKTVSNKRHSTIPPAKHEVRRTVELTFCPACNGRGSELYSGKDCKECDGTGFVNKKLDK